MKYIKHPIPEEISDKGGASVQLVQKQTIPLDGAIDDAIEAHYAIGQKEFIRNGVIGTMKSMAAGVRRDGRPRSIEGFLTVFPVFKGPVDLEKGFDPAVNKVQIKARLLNELELDISNWTFEDVTPGKRSFKLDSVKAGAVLNVVEIGEAIAVNGQEMPSTKAGEELRVHWEVEGTDKSGDIPAAKMTSDVGRADIAADALAELASEEYDGKTIVFTVRGNFSSAKISATLKYAAPKKRVVLSNGSVDGSAVFFEAENPEGIRDYVNDGITEEYSVDLWKNGTLVEAGAHAVHVLETGAPYVQYEDFAEAGDTVKIVAHVNPAKTDFVQEDAVLEFTVE